MEIDYHRIQEHYESMSDEHLVRMATHHAGDMRPELVDVLRAELHKRNLLPHFEPSIKAQTKVLSEQEMAAYAEMIQQHPCPVCGSDAEKLNATVTQSYVSYFLWSNSTLKLRIACPDCLDRFNSNAISRTFLFTFWAIPHGWFSLIDAFSFNKKMQRQNRQEGPNGTLFSFIKENAGVLEMVKNRQMPASDLFHTLNS